MCSGTWFGCATLLYLGGGWPNPGIHRDEQDHIGDGRQRHEDDYEGDVNKRKPLSHVCWERGTMRKEEENKASSGVASRCGTADGAEKSPLTTEGIGSGDRHGIKGLACARRIGGERLAEIRRGLKSVVKAAQGSIAGFTV